MENISLIKVHTLYLKNVFNLYEKVGNYFWDNAIPDLDQAWFTVNASPKPGHKILAWTKFK